MSSKTKQANCYSTPFEGEHSKAKRKVLYIHPISGTGGALIALLRILDELDMTRFCYKVVCPNEGASYDLLTDRGFNATIDRRIKSFSHHVCGWYSIKHIHRMVVNLAYIPISAFFTYRIVRREKPNLVHLGSGALLGPALGAKIARVPIVWHIREHLADGYLGIGKRIIAHYIDWLSDRIIAIRQSEAKRLKRSKNLIVIYDCVDFKEFDREIRGDTFRREFKLTSNNKCVAMFGAVTPYKGTLQFVEAAIKILEEHKDMRFFVFGPIHYHKPPRGTFEARVKLMVSSAFNKKAYEYYNNIKKLIPEDKQDKITIFGNRRDVAQIVAGVDLVVSPYILPHSSLPIMEAGAMAKPVVASNWGEPDELVLNGITGILVPPGDSAALARAIVEILSCPERARKMGEEGYKRAKELFNANKNMAKLARVYDEILE